MASLQWLERLMPAGLDDRSELRSRFLIRAWVCAMAGASFTIVLYAVGGIWSQVVSTGLILVAGPPLLWLHKRGANFTMLGHVSMAAGAAAFALGSVGQRPADYTSLALLLLVPLLSFFVLGRRGLLVWMVITFVLGSLVVVCIDRSLTFDFVDPMPTPSHVVNYGIGVVLVWVFSSVFDDVNQGALDRLRAADAARRAFLANISHEIRTPMNGVLGLTEVLLLETPTAHQREQLETIQRSGRTLVTLINDLLDLSKMEAGKLELHRADFNLARLLDDVEALAAPLVSARGLKFSRVHTGTLPERLYGDGVRLGQVLNNLMSNAVKFTDHGSVRLVVAVTAPLRLRFTVEDTGVGISREAQARLFTAFQQIDSSSTRRFGGTGLGLALSQQLIELMGGRITVESQPGRGTRFSFELQFDEATTPTGEVAARALVTERQRTVLVVDDNPINLRVAVELVRKAGCEATGVTNGALAVQAIRERAFDLVLMDCHMPEMDGFEATEKIRALDGARGRTPIVALTASAMPDEIAACHRAGMNRVLTKPVSFAALEEVLKAA
jgi:signal transduction histidine kinase